MSILGTLVRVLPSSIAAFQQRLSELPGADLALNPGDGRLVVVLDDVPEGPHTAAQCLTLIAAWPEVLSITLVYEYSGPDAPAPQGAEELNFRSWRGSRAQIERSTGLGPKPTEARGLSVA